MTTLPATLAAALLVLTGCAAAGPSASGGHEPGTVAGWERLPDGPLGGRVGAAVAAVGSEVLVVGGWEWLCPPAADCAFPDLPLLADGAALDPATAEWRSIADAPYGVRHAETATLEDDLYLLSGCRRSRGCDGRPELLRYDVGADRWSVLAALP